MTYLLTERVNTDAINTYYEGRLHILRKVKNGRSKKSDYPYFTVKTELNIKTLIIISSRRKVYCLYAKWVKRSQGKKTPPQNKQE